ncbi:hypothetical protein RMATCC62417_11880 [Rhizopus microsporus]|nr:hypothetical protein RMATCC62417_11880 [Rhizopus microsporus]
MNNILKSIDMNPFSIETEKNNYIAYTSTEQLKRLLDCENTKDNRSTKQIKLSFPYDLSEKKPECCHTPKLSEVSVLNQTIKYNPYGHVLQFDESVEIGSDSLDTLNSTWRFKPYIPIVCAQTLAGSTVF